MLYKALIQQLKESMTVNIHYYGTGIYKADLQLPNGEIKKDVQLKLYIDDVILRDAHYDSNIYGVEPQYAVGGWFSDNELEYNLDSVEIEPDDMDALNLPEGTKVIKITQCIEEDLDVREYE